jgi:alkylated DNA repair dioxygenase AlkB
MIAGLQASLLDLTDEPVFTALDATVHRRELTAGAWIDTRPGWLSGATELFAEVLDAVAWRAERRQMYDRVVDVPRLTCFFGEGEPLPHPILDEALAALNARYAAELGEPLRTAGLCLYRDGRDSVAWHGDDLGRGRSEDTMVAILSLGSPRPLLLRPRRMSEHRSERQRATSGANDGHGGAATIRHNLGHGDLIVMGGSCQRTWEHAVPKTARPVGPRISVQFRPRGVR